MPLYRLTTRRADLDVNVEDLRAFNDEQARAQAQIRLARCREGDTLVLSLQGVERGRFGPRRMR